MCGFWRGSPLNRVEGLTAVQAGLREGQMDKGALVVFCNFGIAGHLWRSTSHRRALPALGAVAFCLCLAGCATTQTTRSDDRQAIIDRIVASTAKVMVEQDGHRLSTGSGVVVASQVGGPSLEAVSYVLTAAHVVDGADGTKVIVRFTGAYATQGKFVATISCRGNPDTLDLALLKVPGIAVPPAVFPMSEDEVRLGEGILLIGFPWGKRMGLFSGIVSQMPADGGVKSPADEGTDPTIVVDAASAKGVSGGGVFREATGSLIGVVEGYQTASVSVKDKASTYSINVPMPGETFVVSIPRIRRFLQESGVAGTTAQ
jgi:S1-C subfamily serine protease